MSNSSPFNSYVSPHMVSSIGLVCDGGQRQQFWDWDAAATQAPSIIHPHPSFFTSGSSSDALYDCTAVPLVPTAGGSSGGSGDRSGCPFYPAMGDEYPPAQGLLKSKEDIVPGQLGLNLGHRTYFPTVRPNAPRCQAEGCKADLSAAKHYHRRHKVCEYHSKAVAVVAGGLQQRFCQQCSRFHVLSEFDEAKRSCRKRLADHNRRRRKPQLLPSAPTTASDRRAHPRSTYADIKQETSLKPTKGTATAEDVIVTKTVTSFSTVPTANQSGMSLESPNEHQKKASCLRNGPAVLSLLGGTEGAPEEGSFGFNDNQYRTQRPWPGLSDDGGCWLRRQQQQQHITSSSSSTTFFHHNLFLCSSNDASLAANGGGRDQAHDQNNPLHHGQGIFEADYFI